MKKATLSLFASVLFLAAPVAQAQESPQPPTPPLATPTVAAPSPPPGAPPAPPSVPRTMPTVSLTFSPLHLLLPVLEVAAELRASDRMSLAFIAGGGHATTVDGDTFSVWEAGAHVRYYALGDFLQGMQLGLEVLYLGVSGNAGGSTAAGAGLGIGPFIGYKYVAPVGFTVDLQAGPEFLVIHAEAPGQTADQKTVIPLLNVNIGWSF